MKPIRILLADDHALLRAGIRSLLAKYSDLAVVGEAKTGHEALAGIHEQRPDIVLMDIAMPEMNGLETAACVTKKFPAVRVIILSIHGNEEYVISALRAGAAGYLLKDAVPDELEAAIRAVANGQTYLSPSISKHVVNEVLRSASGKPSSLERLTLRQRETLQLLAEGHSNKKIAQMLRLSVKTVEMHRTRLMKRLGVHDVASLVRCAIRLGLIGPET